MGHGNSLGVKNGKNLRFTFFLNCFLWQRVFSQPVFAWSNLPVKTPETPAQS